MPGDFFDQIQAFKEFDQSPDILSGVKPHYKWLKNEIADSSKTRQVEDDLFDPENTHLSTDEYRVKVEKDIAQAKLDQESSEKEAMINNAVQNLNADSVLEQINLIRESQGKLPLVPDKAELQDPSFAQGLIGALGAILFPESSFEIAATPFQNQLSEQAQEQGRLDQAHQEQLRRANLDAELGMQGALAVQRTNELNFQAATQRENREDTQQFQKDVIDINFENALTMSASAFGNQLTLLDETQQHSMAMFFLGTAFDPNVGAETRGNAATKLTAMGISVDIVTGMTIQETSQLVSVSIAWSEEKRRAELFPLQKAEVEKRNALLDVQVNWADRMAEMQYETGVLAILNTNDEIRHRRFTENFQTDEQRRLYLSQLGSLYMTSRNQLAGQISANNDAIVSLTEQLGDASISDSDKETIRTQIEKLNKANQAGMTALNSIDESYELLSDTVRSELGLEVEGTNNGESFLGTPYSWGGGSLTGPTKGIGRGQDQVGFDCSGLTRAVANLDHGVKIPRTCKAQWDDTKNLRMVSLGLDGLKDAKNGDFLYFRSGDDWHTGILIARDGQLYIRHAPNTGAVVRDELLEDFLKNTTKKFVGIRRVNTGRADPTIVPPGALQGG